MPMPAFVKIGLRRPPSSTIRQFLASHRCPRPFFTGAIPPKPATSNHSRRFSFTQNPGTHAKPPKPGSPLDGLANSFARGQQDLKQAAEGKKPKPFFPDTNSPTVGHWLLGSAGLVFGIVVLGGLTRLTESGLSITEWKPITGALPPTTLQGWESNFSKYRDSPEYRILNPKMTLEEYKSIYYMEWAHRLWGRVIGLTFVLPGAYFVCRRRVTGRMAAKIAGISAMIAMQGVIGWWMVKSGIQDDLFQEPGAHPKVSQYRLTAHLAAAFAVYSAMVWNGLAVMRENRMARDPHGALEEVAALANSRLRLFRWGVGVVAVMVSMTAMSGGLVAGLDAGLIYNEFPKMGAGFAPPITELMDPFYSRRRDHSDLWWRNMLENPTTVQFDHRCLALSTFSLVVALYLYSRLNPRVAAALTKPARKGMRGVLHLAIMQVLLGVGTLVYMVPTELAATHQAGSLALLTGAIVLGSRVWLPRSAAVIARRRIEAMAAAKGFRS